MSADPSLAWLSEARRLARPFLFTTANPVAHNLRNLAVLGAITATMVGTIALGTQLRGLAYIPVAGVVFGACFFTLISLVVHEASHGMFLLASTRGRTRRLNRIFGWACAAPFGIHYVRHWEVGHNLHHARPLVDEDPQRFNTRTGADLLRTVLALVFIPAWGFVHRFVNKRPGRNTHSSPALLISFLVFWGTVLPTLGLTIGWWVPVGVFWGLQNLLAINEIKGALEHGQLASETEVLLRSRSSLVPFIALFSPWNVSLYHFEHHLHAAVPWYRLPAYHRAVRHLVPAHLSDDIYNRRLLRQLSGGLALHGTNGKAT